MTFLGGLFIILVFAGMMLTAIVIYRQDEKTRTDKWWAHQRVMGIPVYCYKLAHYKIMMSLEELDDKLDGKQRLGSDTWLLTDKVLYEALKRKGFTDAEIAEFGL
jgi:hypothetical protein